MGNHQAGVKEADRARLEVFQERQRDALRKAGETARECFREREAAAATAATTAATAAINQVRVGGPGGTREKGCIRGRGMYARSFFFFLFFLLYLPPLASPAAPLFN